MSDRICWRHRRKLYLLGFLTLWDTSGQLYTRSIWKIRDEMTECERCNR